MPQMSPMWWEVTYMIFSLLFLVMNIMVYFSINKKLNMMNMKKSLKINQFNWKW